MKENAWGKRRPDTPSPLRVRVVSAGMECHESPVVRLALTTRQPTGASAPSTDEAPESSRPRGANPVAGPTDEADESADADDDEDDDEDAEDDDDNRVEHGTAKLGG